MRALRRHRSTARLQVRCAAGALTALLLGCGAADAAGPYRPFQTGLWSGGAYTDDRSGKFSHCSVGVVYEGGTSLFVVSTEARGWWLGLTNPQWSLIPGAVVPVRLQFDTRAPIDLSGSAADAQLLLVAMPDDSHLIDTFRRTTKLSFVAQDRSFSLQLGGAARVISELTSCVRDAVGLDKQLPADILAPGHAASGIPDTTSPPPLNSPSRSSVTNRSGSSGGGRGDQVGAEFRHGGGATERSPDRYRQASGFGEFPSCLEIRE
jgi:hypothetical protein